MAVGGRGITVRVDQQAIFAMARDRNGPLVQPMQHAAEIVTQGAKRRAPTSPHGSQGRRSGWLRSSIGWELDTDPRGVLEVRVGSHAITDEGFDYGLAVEVGTKAHPIDPKTPGGVLVFEVNGQTVFARHVDHPGTPAQPHLRPALDDLAGKKL